MFEIGTKQIKLAILFNIHVDDCHKVSCRERTGDIFQDDSMLSLVIDRVITPHGYR